jgi:glycosidase
MPTIYYGDEIGLKGSKEWGDNRRGMIWDEKGQDLELHGFCRKLINVRKKNRALTDGDFATLHSDSKTNTSIAVVENPRGFQEDANGP